MEPLYIILSVAGAAILFLVTAVWRSAENKARELQDENAATNVKCTAIAVDLANYKIKIAEEYVSRETLREMEERIVKAIEAISETQGRIFEELKSKADKS